MSKCPNCGVIAGYQPHTKTCPRYMRWWEPWECRLMNWLDFRYWFCDCHYQDPYGKVIMGGCPKHD